MAKRKTARSSRGKGAGKRAGTGRTRGGAKKSAARPRAAATRTAAKRATVKRTTVKRAATKRPAVKRTAAKRAAPKRAGAAARQKRTAAVRRSATTSTARAKMSRPTSPSRTTTKKTTKSAPAIPQSAPKMARASKTAPKTVLARKMPALNRERRTVQDEDIVPTPPSSLDLDRSASAVRTGRREMLERYNEHTETSPALTAGDVDADWESAYSVGDEAPGGDNPTPDQDIVDDIGRAVGVEYEDNEELKTEKKITDRDRHRWELDPASSEDYDDR